MFFSCTQPINDETGVEYKKTGLIQRFPRSDYDLVQILSHITGGALLEPFDTKGRCRCHGLKRIP